MKTKDFIYEVEDKSYYLKFDINVEHVSNKPANLKSFENVIEVTDNERSYVSALVDSGIGKIIQANTGVWNNDPDGAIHETGHLFYLLDQYTDISKGGNIVSVPNPGFENNIMATLSGKVESRDINSILKYAIVLGGCYNGRK